MAKAGPRKIAKYGERFKATAVKLSGLPGVLIRDVAAALDVHPFMLSLWRKQASVSARTRRSRIRFEQFTSKAVGPTAVPVCTRRSGARAIAWVSIGWRA